MYPLVSPRRNHLSNPQNYHSEILLPNLHVNLDLNQVDNQLDNLGIDPLVNHLDAPRDNHLSNLRLNHRSDHLIVQLISRHPSHQETQVLNLRNIRSIVRHLGLQVNLPINLLANHHSNRLDNPPTTRRDNRACNQAGNLHVNLRHTQVDNQQGSHHINLLVLLVSLLFSLLVNQ